MHSVKNSRNQNHARSPKGHQYTALIHLKTPPSTRIFLKKPMEIKSKMLAIRKLGVFGLALTTHEAPIVSNRHLENDHRGAMQGLEIRAVWQTYRCGDRVRNINKYCDREFAAAQPATAPRQFQELAD